MKEPIRILHVIGTMHRGGAETMIMNYYRSIDRTKVQFDFVENQGMQADFDEEILSLGGRIFRCPYYKGKNHIAYVRWWKRFIQEHSNEFAAVHGHLGSTASIYLPICKKAGLFAIAHSHNTNRFNLKGMVYQVYAWPTRFIADFFFGCSLDAGISRYGKRVCKDANKFRVLNNAIDTEKFGYREKNRKTIRAKLGIEDKIVIGHVGRFEEQKNHKFLIEIFERIYRQTPNAVLLLVGDGTLRIQIEEKVQAMHLSDSVIFAGLQNDVSNYYQAMDVLAMPSLYEGKPYVVIEAQASGLPCVISDKVPDECMVAKDVVSIMPLESSPDAWAAHILERLSFTRMNRVDEIKQSGYDIKENVEWLERFYLKIGADMYGEQ